MSKLEDRKAGEILEEGGKKKIVLSEYKELEISDDTYKAMRDQKIAEIANLEAYIAKTKQEYDL